MTQHNILHAAPENVKFVMGPNGQLIAMQKPPFVWKDFAIGGGIPFALFFIPVFILMVGSLMGFDGGEYNQIELTKQENGTAYQGEFDSLAKRNISIGAAYMALPKILIMLNFGVLKSVTKKLKSMIKMNP